MRRWSTGGVAEMRAEVTVARGLVTDVSPAAGEPLVAADASPGGDGPRRKLDLRATARWILRWLPWGVFGLAVVGGVRARAQAPWISPLYLAVLLALGVAGWRIVRWRSCRPALRSSAAVVVLALFAALTPVPWLKADLANPPGTAWRLDGRLVIDGERIDPPGAWYWLTVGRPPLVAEVVRTWLFDDTSPRSMTGGRVASRPQFNEPAAAAVGLRRAGRDVPFGLMVEVTRPLAAGLPERAVITALNGTTVSSRAAWDEALAGLAGHNTFTTDEGATYEFDGVSLPYGRTDVLDVPLDDLDAAIGGWFSTHAPGKWFRNLALGRSHGLMVALVTYAHASGDDLARGRAIAGTGGIDGDGSVVSIGGLVSKATAARRAGADVLLYPAAQAYLLEDFDAGSMRLVPASNLDEAIDALLR